MKETYIPSCMKAKSKEEFDSYWYNKSPKPAVSGKKDGETENRNQYSILEQYNF